MNEIRETAAELASGLRRLGPNRVVALSTHVTRELITDLEEKANRLVELLASEDKAT